MRGETAGHRCSPSGSGTPRFPGKNKQFVRRNFRCKGVFQFAMAPLLIPLLFLLPLCQVSGEQWTCFSGLVARQVSTSGSKQVTEIDALLAAHYAAIDQGRFAEVEQIRNKITSKLDEIPVSDPRYLNWAILASQTYNGTSPVRARTTLERAIARAEAYAKAPSTTIALLDSLATNWEQQRNLLESIRLREKAQNLAIKSSLPYRLELLADLYKQVGRIADAELLVGKLAAGALQERTAAAYYFARNDRFEDAEKVLHSALRELKISAEERSQIQSQLSNLYQNAGRFSDAAELIQKQLREAGNTPSNTIHLKFNLAGTLGQTGQTAEGDAIYEQLLTNPSSDGPAMGVLGSYSQYLIATKRPEKAEQRLNAYLEDHKELAMGERNNLLSLLAGAAEGSGNFSRASEYRKQARIGDSTTCKSNSLWEGSAEMQAAVAHGDSAEIVRLVREILSKASSLSDRNNLPFVLLNSINALREKHPAEAIRLSDALLNEVESWSPLGVGALFETLSQRTHLFSSMQAWREAEETLAQMEQVAEANYGSISNQMLLVRQQELLVDQAAGNQSRAITRAEQMLELEHGLTGEKSAAVVHVLQTMAETLTQADQGRRAIQYGKRALDVASIHYRLEHPIYQSLVEFLAAASGEEKRTTGTIDAIQEVGEGAAVRSSNAWFDRKAKP